MRAEDWGWDGGEEEAHWDFSMTQNGRRGGEKVRWAVVRREKSIWEG